MDKNLISIEQLLAYAHGDLNPADCAEVEAKLQYDVAARETLALYNRARQATVSDDSVAPPEHAVARAKSFYVAPQRARLIEQAQQFIARLVFDSRTQPALAGVRSISHACSLVYETDHESVDVQAEPVRDADGMITLWQVVGQVAHAQCEGACPVAFVRKADSVVVGEATLDARGVFTTDVAPGAYQLRINLPGRTIVVADLDLT